MLASLIRWKGKRKGNGATEPSSHSKSPLASPLPSSVVFDINEASVPPSAARTPVLAELNLSGSGENWFPPELLNSRDRSPRSSLRRAESAKVAKNNFTQVTRANSSSSSSTGHPGSMSPHSKRTFSRKKLVPAPIKIPDAELHVPNIQIGRLDVPSVAPVARVSQSNTNGTSLSPSSPSASDNLTADSGASLTRAFITSTFLLFSNERRSMRHRNRVVRQDSATLPSREPVFDPRRSPSAPLVSSVPAASVGGLSNSACSPTVKSEASSDSVYPISEAYITSPEVASSSEVPRRVSYTQENLSPTVHTSIGALPHAISDVGLREKTGTGLTCTRAVKRADFDVPKTAVEVALPTSPRGAVHHSSQEGSSALSSDEHSLDEFDFVPPEPFVVIASPGSDSSASYAAPFPKCSDTKRRRRVGGSNLVRSYLVKDRLDITPLLHQGCGIPSGAISESDYGELLNYDMTLGSGSSSSSHILSSGSPGRQTFPETPMIISPLWSPIYSLLTKSDGQMLRRHPRAPRSAGLGNGPLRPSMRIGRRQMDNSYSMGSALRRSRSSFLPRREMSLLAPSRSNLLPCAQVDEEEDVPDETNRSSVANTMESQNRVDLPAPVRPHPLAHISTSSSCLAEEEALRALVRHSLLSLSSIFIDDGAPPHMMPIVVSVIDPFVESSTSFPVTESTNKSYSISPAMTASSSANPLQPTFTSTNTVVSERDPPESLSLARCSTFGESFLPSQSAPAPLDGPLAQLPSPTPIVPSTPLLDESISPSLFPPPPYHTVVSERTVYHPGPSAPHSLSPEPSYQYRRDVSDSFPTPGSARDRGRMRPRPPIGPRRPTGAGQLLVPGNHSRNGSASSVGSCDLIGPLGSPWHKLQRVASKPPPKFQTPPPKWRGLTLEAAQWTFTSAQLQAVVSRAIQQSSEGSSIRLLRLEVLEGEIADEMHRLELEHTDVKAQYKALLPKRWTLMGTLAVQIEGGETYDTPHTMESLAEVLLALDDLAERAHGIVLQMAQLKSLCEVHNTSALALAVRKINGVFVRQMAEKERLQEHVDTLTTERDEAWRHAEDVARDYDTLNDCTSDKVCADGGTRLSGDVRSSSHTTSSGATKRLTRISAVRKSSTRLSQAGLRPRSKYRSGRRSSNDAPPRPVSFAPPSDGVIPPLPRFSVHRSSEGSALATGTSFALGSKRYSPPSPASDALALAAVQREVYEMLGLSVPPSQASSRWSVGHQSISTPSMSVLDSTDVDTHVVGSRKRPASELHHPHNRRCLEKQMERATRTRSAILDDRPRSIGLI